MPKKSFKDNPAMTFINTPKTNTQEEVQEVTHEHTQQDIYEDVQENTHEVESVERRLCIRTQGRKGHKKPRINLAFDSEIFLNEIRKRADLNGMSITQLVNEAVAYYLDKIKK